jgi:hypothetical protein
LASLEHLQLSLRVLLFSPEILGDKLRTRHRTGAAAGFDSTGYRWLLHMTGGEPGIYPQFVELCEALTERHFYFGQLR